MLIVKRSQVNEQMNFLSEDMSQAARITFDKAVTDAVGRQASLMATVLSAKEQGKGQEE